MCILQISETDEGKGLCPINLACAPYNGEYHKGEIIKANPVIWADLRKYTITNQASNILIWSAWVKGWSLTD